MLIIGFESARMSASDPIANPDVSAVSEFGDEQELADLYLFGGWRLASDFPIPALPTAAKGDADVKIVAGRVPAQLEGAVAASHPVLSVGTDGTVLLTIPGLLRILIEDACRVTVDVLANQVDVSIGMLLRGPVLAILARQRGMLPFQGSVVRLGDGAIALLGPSGCGKSVLAALLAQRGFEVLSDGLCLMTPDPDGTTIQPLSPVLRLWPDALAALDVPALEVRPYRSDGGYGFVTMSPATASPPMLPVPLRGIFVLCIDKCRCKDVAIVGLRPAETIGRLSATLSARPAMVAGPWGRDVGKQLATVAAAGPVMAIHPAENWAQGALLTDAILDYLSGGIEGKQS